MTLDELQRRDARIAALEALGRRRSRDEDHELALETKRRDQRWECIPRQIERAHRRATDLAAYARQIGLPLYPPATE